MAAISEREIRIRRRLHDDYPYFAAKCLKIRTKSGEIRPLIFNRAQLYLHERIERQRAETGMVRAVILKGRQQGCSTYVAGRGYHKTTWNRGIKSFILTHLDDATNNLFGMVERFHEHNNPLVKPQTGYSNAKELTFKSLESGYVVGTAGSRGVGRSDTIQFFHGSEVALWPNAEKHATGVMRAVPPLAGTEVYLESTAQGLGNFFADQWAVASAGRSLFQAIFIPWFWQDEYRLAVPEGFERTPEENDIAEAFGLDDEQIYWRRMEIASTGKEWMFQQEYPNTPEEAFRATGEGSFIGPIFVAKARKAKVEPAAFVPVVLGVDPGLGGPGDKCAVIDRQGRRAGQRICEEWDERDTMVIAGRIVKVIEKIRPARVFIDVGGLGIGIYDRLAELGFANRRNMTTTVEAVNFGSAAVERDRYANKRAEIYDEMRQWLESQLPVQIPDRDDLQSDLCAAIWGPQATRQQSNGALILEPKERIKKRKGGRSPNLADALACTFAGPLAIPAGPLPQIGNTVADMDAGY